MQLRSDKALPVTTILSIAFVLDAGGGSTSPRNLMCRTGFDEIATYVFI